MIELEGSTCGGILVKFFFLYKLFPGAYDPEARSMEFNSDLCVSRDDVLNLFFDGVTGIRRPITTNQSSFSNLRNLKHEPLKPENPKTTNTRQSCNPAKEISQHHQSTNCNWKEVYLQVTTVVPRCERPAHTDGANAQLRLLSLWCPLVGALASLLRLRHPLAAHAQLCLLCLWCPLVEALAQLRLLRVWRPLVEALARLLHLGCPLVKARTGLLHLWRPLGAHARLCLLRLRRLRCPLVC